MGGVIEDAGFDPHPRLAVAESLYPYFHVA